MLVSEGLVKQYGARRALDGFDLTIESGEIAGLVGHNGAGKTTFVEVVTGLIRPDAGRVSVGGVDVGRDPRGARLQLGVAPEELHLTDVLGQRAGLLSGGQQRRTQTAAALVGGAPLLLLDEPTAGADPQTRAALLAAVRARAAAGAAVLYTTHYLPELADLGATLAVARSGRIIARGTQDDLIQGLPGELRLRLVDGELRITSTNPPADLAALLAAGCSPAAVDVRSPSLDDLYRALAPEVPHAA